MLTPEIEQIIKAYFYSGIGNAYPARSLMTYIDQNELVCLHADGLGNLDQDVYKLNINSFTHDVTAYKQSGGWPEVVTNLIKRQRETANRIGEIKQIAEQYAQNPYKSLSSKKKFAAGFSRSIKNLEQLVKETEVAIRLARSK